MSDTPQAPDTAAELQTPAVPQQPEQPNSAEPQTQNTQESPAPAQPAAQPSPTETPAADATPPDPAAEAPPTPERVVPAADGYKLPEGVPPAVAEFAAQNDMTQQQLDNNLNYFGQISKAKTEAESNALRQAGEAHIKNWGDNAEHKLGLAKRALKQNDPEGSLTKALNASGYGNHPAVLDFLSNLGGMMQEGGFLPSAVNVPPGKKSLAQTMFGESHPSKG